MPPSTPKLVLGASIVFFAGSTIYVTWKKEQDRKDMRIAVDMDKERIQRWMEREQDGKNNDTNNNKGNNWLFDNDTNNKGNNWLFW